MASLYSQAVVLPGPIRRHVLVATFPAFGHIIPLLEIAKKVSQFHDVTFAVSSTQLADLTNRELIQPTDTIRLHAIHDGAHINMDNMSEKGAISRFFQTVLDAMGKLFREMPTQAEPNKSDVFPPVDVVISDMFLSQPAAVLKQRRVLSYLFNAATANLVLFILSISEDTPILETPEGGMAFMKMSEAGVAAPPMAQSTKDLFHGMKVTLTSATGLIVNSFREIESDDLGAIAKDPITANLTVHCVGPLLPVERTSSCPSQVASAEKIGRWLNRQVANSVVYIAFGSMVTPTPAQITEIGQALLKLEQPFIFSIRETYYNAFPNEITTRISRQFDDPDNKFLVIPWAPQKAILGHVATAAFVSHCGWNSTLECLASGKPIIAWPLTTDQMTNAEWIVKLGAGLLVTTAGIMCRPLVPAKDIAHLVQKVGGWGNAEGKRSSYSDAATTWGEKINATWREGGSSYIEFMDLVAFRECK